jgi:hypothetical protein
VSSEGTGTGRRCQNGSRFRAPHSASTLAGPDLGENSRSRAHSPTAPAKHLYQHRHLVAVGHPAESNYEEALVAVAKFLVALL